MNEHLEESLVTLGNASTVVARVIQKIAGNDISNTLGNSRLTVELIGTIVQSRIANNLSKCVGRI